MNSEIAKSANDSLGAWHRLCREEPSPLPSQAKPTITKISVITRKLVVKTLPTHVPHAHTHVPVHAHAHVVLRRMIATTIVATAIPAGLANRNRPILFFFVL